MLIFDIYCRQGNDCCDPVCHHHFRFLDDIFMDQNITGTNPSAPNRRPRVAAFQIRRVNPMRFARFSRSSTVNTCLIRIARIEFATPKFQFRKQGFCPLYFVKRVSIRKRFCCQIASSDRCECSSDRSDVTLPETKR